MIATNKNNINDCIILVGFMGSGKTSIGKLLSSKLNSNFYDTDEMIIKQTGKTISQIFEDEGEEHFRKLECNIVKELETLENGVISTGGGLPLYHDNMSVLNKIGITFYLKNSVKELTNRIFSDKNRPLVKNYSTPKQLYTFIKSTLALREKFYSKSQYTVDCKNKTIEDITNEILNTLISIK